MQQIMRSSCQNGKILHLCLAEPPNRSQIGGSGMADHSPTLARTAPICPEGYGM
jgi:hypothetical protein